MLGRHVLTLTVEDSSGNIANASIEFQVDKSLRLITREQNIKRVKDSIQSWKVNFNSLLGPLVAGLILSAWRFNRFTGTKIVVLLVLKYVFLLPNIDEDVLTQQVRAYLEDHKFIRGRVDFRLHKIVTTLEDLKVRFPDRNATIDKFIVFIETLLENLDLENKRPIISDPYPLDGAKYVDIDTEKVFITVEDPEGDPFNVTISGDYVNDITYTNVYNGSFNSTLITPLPLKEEIVWNVVVIDNNDKEISNFYKFETHYE
jgi:hypothetical protein